MRRPEQVTYLIDWYRNFRQYYWVNEIPEIAKITYDALWVLKISDSKYFTSQSCSNIINLIGCKYRLKWSQLSIELQQSLLAAVKHNMAQFSPQEIANTMNAFANLKINWKSINDTIQQGLLAAIECNMAQLNPQEIANTMNAFANLEINWKSIDVTIKQGLLTAVERNMEQFNPQDVSSTMNAFSNLKINWPKLPSMMRQGIMDAVGLNIKGITSSTINSIQIADAISKFAVYEQVNPRYCAFRYFITIKQYDEIHNSAVFHLRESVHVSKGQREIFSKVRSIVPDSVPVEMEWIPPDTYISVDIAIPSLKIIIEVNGPQHYTDNNISLNQHSRHKLYFLEQFGYKVLNINLQMQWSRLKHIGKIFFISNFIKSSQCKKEAILAKEHNPMMFRAKTRKLAEILEEELVGEHVKKRRVRSRAF